MSEGRRWAQRVVGHGEVDPRTIARHPLNPKIHTPEQDAVVEASLRELGWVKSVIINRVTGHLLDGHERVELAVERGESTVPVEYVEMAEADEGKALLVLDPSGALARTHVEHWARLRAAVRTEEPALAEMWGRFAQAQPRRAESEDTDTAAQPEAGAGGAAAQTEADRDARLEQGRAAWGVEPGQLWGCGAHRVWCGEAEDAASWARLAEACGTVQGCMTSPPYAEQRARQYGGIAPEAYVGWMLGIAGQLRAGLAERGSWLLNLKEHSAGIRRPVYVHALLVALVEQGGWTYLDEYCWERHGVPGAAETRGKLKNMWEPVFWLAKQVRPVFHPERVRHRTTKAFVDTDWQPGLDRLQGTGRDFLGGDGRKGAGWAEAGNRLPSFGTAGAQGHPAAYPMGLPRFFVELHSEPGDWWVDPFLGSGTTLMACEELGRVCWGMEREPRYVAGTLQRYLDATGVRPERLEG